MVNRIFDAVYLSCKKNKISYKKACDIINQIEDDSFTEIFKQYSIRPYKKRQFLDREISEVNPEEDLKGYINRLSLSVSDMLIMFDGHRENLNRVKSSGVLKTKFFENYKKNLNNLVSQMLAFQDILLELLECDDEIEMNQILENYLGEAE